MIYGHIEHLDSYRFLLRDPAWDRAFTALRSLTPDSLLGVTELDGEQQYLNVHTYPTRRADDCRFEHHRRMIDLQCIIAGGERIDWAPAWELKPDGAYRPEDDFQFLQPPRPSSANTTLHLTAGYFAIFFPSDAHRPQITDGLHAEVYKAVVKTDHNLLDL